MTYACPYCRWSLSKLDPADYPDTAQGQDVFAADYVYFDLEKERYPCRHSLRALSTPRIVYLLL